MNKRTIALLFLLIFLNFSVAAMGQNQGTARKPPILTVGGEVAHPLNLTPSDLAKLPRLTVTTKDHEQTATFEGIALIEILRLAGVEFGEKLRGKGLALYLVVEAADGYRAVFALPELDVAFTDNLVILTDKRDGKPLSEKEGQWRIVAPSEKRPARWVRQVIALTIRRA